MSRTTSRTIARSFAGGVVSPELFGRIDLRGYQTGLQQCDNFVVLPHGPITKRPGFEYGFPIELTGGVSRARFLPFATSGNGIGCLLTETHIWFVKNNKPICETVKTIDSLSGTTVTEAAHGYSVGDVVFIGSFSSGVPSVGDYWKVATVPGAGSFTVTPLLAGIVANPSGASVARLYRLSAATDTALLKKLRYSQSGSTITFCSGVTPPVELTRTSDTSWAVATPDFATTQSAPVIAQLTPSTLSTALADTKRYLATAVSESGEESIASLWAPSYPGNVTVSSATNANPTVITLSGAVSFIVGDLVRLEGLVGGTWGTLDGNEYEVVTAVGTDITLKTQSTGATLSGVGLGTVTSGTVALVGTRCDLTAAGATVKVPVNNISAYRYNIYKQDSSSKLFGFAGTLDPAVAERGNNFFMFTDDNIVPDVTRTPPEDWNPFEGSGNYPLAVAHNEQRRVFGGTENEPQRVFMTPIGFEDSMAQHFPIQDNDAFDFTISSRVRHQVQHIVALGDLLVLTSASEFQVKSADGGAITAASVNARAQSYVGANDVQPAVAEATAVFVSRSGDRPHEVAYARDGSGGYQAVDISVFCPQFFSGYTIVDLAYCRGDVPSLWAVRSDGVLLGCTYSPGQEVRAWHKHTTDGTVQSVGAVFEDTTDRLYTVVSRDVDGTNYLFIERMKPWTFDTITDAVFTDGAWTKTGAASTSVTGLYHLEGETVSALGDGKVFTGLVVSAGAITLPEACATVHIGRPYTAAAKTLPLAFEAAGDGLGRSKGVVKAFLRLYKSSGLKLGSTFTNLYPHLEPVPDFGDPYALITGVIETPISTENDLDGALCIQSDDPRPMTIQAISLEVLIGA